MDGPINYSKYSSNYESVSRQIVNEPKNQRPCTDICCTITFIILMVAFIGVGIYEVMEYQKLFSDSIVLQDPYNFEFTDYWPLILIAGLLSLGTAFFYVIMIKMFPVPMIYAMIIISLGIMAIITVAGLIFGQIGIAIGMGITLLIYLIVLYCLKHKIRTGIVLVSIATKFMTQQLKIFIAPVIKIALSMIVGAFWVYTFNCIVQIMQHKQAREEDQSLQIGLTVFWMLMWLINLFVFYYMMTFTIAVVCAHWYYRLQGRSPLLLSYRWMFKQFGSLVFGAIILAFVTLARMLAQQKRRDTRNVAVAICMTIVACLIKCVEDLLKILNHYTVIVMSLTGQGYIEGAKSTMGLLFSDLGLLSITNLICNFLVFWGLIISVGTPCIISYVYLTTTDLLDDQIGQMLGIIVIFSLLLSTVVYQIATESVSCIFIFFVVDKKFVEYGLIAQNRFPQEQYMKLQNYPQINPYAQTNNGNGNTYQKM